MRGRATSTMRLSAARGRVPVELCVFGGKRSAGICGQTLTEWLKPDDVPAVEHATLHAANRERARVRAGVPAAHRAWAQGRRLSGRRCAAVRRRRPPDDRGAGEQQPDLEQSGDAAGAQSHRAEERRRAARPASRLVCGRRAVRHHRSGPAGVLDDQTRHAYISGAAAAAARQRRAKSMSWWSEPVHRLVALALSYSSWRRHQRPGLVASLGGAVEPGVHAPEAVQSARVGRNRCDRRRRPRARTRSCPADRDVRGHVGSAHGRELGLRPLAAACLARAPREAGSRR